MGQLNAMEAACWSGDGLPALVGLALAGFAAGAINAVAGGGSLISFPAALAAGLSPVTASATNTVALTPALVASSFAYRRELSGKLGLILVLAPPAALGSLIGALLLLRVPEVIFEALVPILVFAATCAILLKKRIVPFAAAPGRATLKRRTWVAAGVLLFAVYGGYFGAGIGIMLLGLLTFLQRLELTEMNGLKCIASATINGVAAAYFIFTGAAALPQAMAMAVGSISGGYAAAWLARGVPAKTLHAVIVTIGLALSLILVARHWL